MIHTLARLTLENFDPPWLWVALLLLTPAVLGATYASVFRRTGQRLAWRLAAVRLFAVLLLLAALVKPVWTRSHTRQQLPVVAVVLDTSESMTLPGHDAASRFDAALALLRDSQLSRTLRRGAQVRCLSIAGDPLDLDELPAEPRDEQTDLVRALHAAGAGERPAAVLLVSDGRDTTGRQTWADVDLPVPLFAVGFPDRAPSKQRVDVSLLRADAPGRTLVNNAVAVRCVLRKVGGEAATLPLILEHAGREMARSEIVFPPGTSQTEATLAFTPTETGDFVMSARLAPAAGERHTADNTAPFRLRVERQPIRVLYIEGVLRPEYTFLRQRLRGDPDVDLISFVRAAHPEQTGSADASAQVVTEERLKKIDVVLLGDFEASMLDPRVYDWLAAWVEQGGGIMVLGGYLNLSPRGLPSTALERLLPVQQHGEHGGELSQIEQPFGFEPTLQGLSHPALTITGEAQRDAELWASLPKLRGVAATGPPRPAATVLAWHPGPPPSVALATQPFGRGISVLLAADSTWRWSRHARLAGAPDALYARFWSQMIRFLAQRPAMPESVLSLATDRPHYPRGQRVSVRVIRNPAAMLPAPQQAAPATPDDGLESGSQAPASDSVVRVSVLGPDDARTDLEALADPADANAWSAAFFPRLGGRHEVVAELLRGPTVVASQRTPFLVAGSGLELDDESTRPQVLAQLAQQSGGLYADVHDPAALSDLAQALPLRPATVQRTVVTPLWNSPVLLGVFLMLVTGEWIVRRRHQLV